MRRTFRYKVYANNETITNANSCLELCRHLYNVGLQQRIWAYHSHHRLYLYDQINQLPELKLAFPEYSKIGSQVLQDVFERLDNAYDGFFRRLKRSGKVGFPRFKSYGRYDSFTLKQAGWKLDGKYLSIRNVGRFKLRLSRPIEGQIKTITIRRESTGKWYACFSCDKVPEKRLESCNKSVGIDVGLKSFCADSDNKVFDNLHHLKKSECILRLRQRRLSRRVKGSNRRNKARILVAKSHEKVTNQRNDFLHKTANYYVKNYGRIYIEDLAVSSMVLNHNLAKAISEVSWSKFFELLSYKAEEAGREVIKVPRFEPTSKTCSSCGEVNQDLTLNDRQWVCKSCGTLHDRDFNAAKNILRVGQTLREVTCVSGRSVSRESP